MIFEKLDNEREGKKVITEYKVEPFTDFSLPDNKEAMEKALVAVQLLKGQSYPIIISGERLDSPPCITSINPSNIVEVIGTAACATVYLAGKAVQAANKAFATWQYVCPSERSLYLLKAAAAMRRCRFEFSAWLVVEAGKTWAEADGETGQAIDYMEYYARQMDKYATGMDVIPALGEQTECSYIPLGVGVIIPPWNFPLATLAGMTAAAIVAGNTVIMKPASSTPIIAAKFMQLWEQVGLPAGVVNYLPGHGLDIGDFLVTHPKVRFINFTGSKEVGLRINKLAAQLSPGQRWLKRVVAEMGGKNAIIVDSEADVEEAATGIVASAFSFQGQKCSACSRVIVVKDVYETLLKKVIEKTKALRVGCPVDPTMDVGPLIDENSYNKILNYIEIGKSEAQLVCGGDIASSKGYFIQPTIFAGVPPQAQIAQEEIFGPVLAIIPAEDFDHALFIANDTEYGLTGAVYSKNRLKLEQARREFHVGNLYFNRKCTGSTVGVHPFGGFNLSGTDSKAGGMDYLLLFLQVKTVCEKL